MAADDDRARVLAWLREEDPWRLEALWRMADTTRREHVGDAVHLRGLIEISAHCVRQCLYCGLRAENARIERYRMSADEIMDTVREAERRGYGTVVLQSGEDFALTRFWVESLVERIKRETGLAVTLGLGERSEIELAAWRRAGADRYLLKFETSDRELYRQIHPPLPGRNSERIAILGTLRALGYETGGGVMVGIPGQSYASLAEDILLFRELDLDMIGIGPYLPHPDTPMGRGEWRPGIAAEEQVPNSEQMTCKVIALARLACPDANIPSTTALATLNRVRGVELGLMRGANVFMPNLTPRRYRANYQIYPGKAYLADSAPGTPGIEDRIRRIGRIIGTGPGRRVMRVRSSPGLRASLS